MQYFRDFLVKIRKMYFGNPKKFYITIIAIFFVSSAAAILVDSKLSFDNTLLTILRSFLLVPLGGSIFTFLYIVSLQLHKYQKERNENWVPFRARYSPAWRVRISIIIFALIALFQYANSHTPFYTLYSSFVFAAVFGLIAFMRKTRKELINEELEIPDSRDIQYRLNTEKKVTKNEKK